MHYEKVVPRHRVHNARERSGTFSQCKVVYPSAGCVAASGGTAEAEVAREASDGCVAIWEGTAGAVSTSDWTATGMQASILASK